MILNIPQSLIVKANLFLKKININRSPVATPDISMISLKEKIQSGLSNPEARALLLELIEDCERENIQPDLQRNIKAESTDIANELSGLLISEQAIMKSPGRFRSLLAMASILVWLLFSAGACANSNDIAANAAAPKTNIIDRIYAMSADQLKEFLEFRFAKKAARKSAVKGWPSVERKLDDGDTQADDDTALNDDSAVDDDTSPNDDTVPDDDTAMDDDTATNDDTNLNDDTVWPDDDWDDDDTYDYTCDYCPSEPEIPESSGGCCGD